VTLHFRADWCPTCRARAKSLEVLKADPDLKLTVLSVDYDKEADLKKQLNIRNQSTLAQFADEYHVPLLPTDVAAVAGDVGESVSRPIL
jgi:thiol-disulfide isomerase/thioredoxin